ncbi:hypothetical protein TRFO_18609 [Tritrichomonas foetus]|uniref:BEACH domain-containing protein n=1 Tax=Tritrichomonas foetus TaxID=1144522 RepID=A0A1J4KPV5_9EUKA|nr:hypothetical protein TRFO_18609 [Tritrichomonas foetus]|eukprot:OHT11820.1 hypothetical protein TRFO_18609 [Tritrichomonas foetus]
MTLFNSVESHPVTAILSINLPKQTSSNVQCLKSLIHSTSFHNFSKEELNSLFGLLSNGQTLTVLKNEFNLRTDVSLNDLQPILAIKTFPDQQALDIAAFFVLRGSITYLTQVNDSFQVSSLLKILNLILHVLDSSYSKILKSTFVCVLGSVVKKIKESFLAEVLQPINQFLDRGGDIPLQLADVMVYIVCSITSQVSQLSETDDRLFKRTGKLITTFASHRNFDNLKEPILSGISPFLKRFDNIAFSFLAQIIPIFPFSDIRLIVEPIPATVIDFIEKETTYYPVPDISSLPEPLVLELEANQRFPFTQMDTFKEGIQMKIEIPEGEKKKLSNSFPDHIIALLRSLYQIGRSSDVQKFFSSSFIKIINQNSENEKLFDIILISLTICRDIELEKVVLKSKLFDPRVSTYNYNSDYDVFFAVRSFVFRLLSRIAPIFEEFIGPLYKMPLITADIFRYMASDVSMLAQTFNKNEQFITFLGKVAGVYQTANIEKTDNIKEIEYARAMIVKFTLNLFKQKESAQNLTSTILYAQMLFSYLYEKELRPFVLDTMGKTCASCDLDLSFCFSDFFYNVFENVSDHQFKQDVIRTANDIISSNNDYRQYFVSSVAPLMSEMKTLEKDEFSKQYLLDVVQFVSNTSDDFHIFNSHILLEAIQRIEGEEPSDEIYNALTSFIAGEKLNEITPTFEIKHPNLLVIYVMAFRKSTKFIPILKLLKDLCYSSRENAHACQIGNLDSLMIDIIQEYKCSSENEIIAPAMSLFVHISSIASSPEAVRKFFSLFPPISPNTVSQNQSLFLSTLSELVTIEEFKPHSYLPLHQNSPVVSISGMTGRHLNSGFTVTLWIYADISPRSYPKFFSITDDKRRGYELSVKDNSLFLKLNGTVEKNLKLAQIPHYKWIHVSLSFVNDKNGLNLITCIDGNITSPIETEWVEFDKGQLTVLFGGVAPGSHSGLDKSALGPFGIFQLLKSNAMIEIARKNLRHAPEHNSRMIYVDIKSVNNTLSISSSEIKGLSAKIVGPVLSIPSTFAQVLVEHCSIGTLLPLLNQLDCTVQDKPQTSSTISMIIILLSSLLSFQPHSQVIFFESNSVRSLAHLLSHSNKNHLDYMIYQHLLNLFELVSYEPLKHEILDKILINLEIWVLADGLSQVQICRYWSRTLFPQYSDTIKKYLSFQRLLNLIRIFYWYTPVEKNIAWLKRAEDIPLTDVRQCLMQILHTFATNHFSPADFSALIGHCISCKDPMQVSDLLSFLKLLAVSPESPIQCVKDVWYQLTSLHHLLNNENELIVFSVVDVFMALHYLGLISHPKVTRHVNILSEMIPNAILTNSFFVKILPLAMKYPDFMPLIFIITMTLGENQTNILKENLQANKNFSEPKHWTLMPLIASYKYDLTSDFSMFVMKFLANCADDKWDEAFASIDLTSRVCNVDADLCKSEFLYDVCERIISTSSLFQFELLHTFLDVAIFHIFFRPNGEMNYALMHAFKNSPFAEDGIYRPDLPTKSPELSKTTFYEKLKEFNSEKRSYTFGLRFDKDGHWLDRKLGQQVVKLAMKTKSQTFHNVTGLILAFLFHETPDEVREQIDQVIKKKVIDPPYSDFLRRLAIDPARKCSESCFESFVRDSTPQNNGMAQYVTELAGRLQRFASKCESEKNEIFENGDNGLCLLNSQAMFSEVCLEAHQRGLYSREWRILWRMMTFNKFPWFSARDEKDDILTRDNTLSEFNCPTQWKFLRIKDNVARFSMTTKLPKRSVQKTMLRAETQPVIGKQLENAPDFYDIRDEIIDIPARIVKFGKVSNVCRFSIENSVISLIFDNSTQEFPVSDISEITMVPVLHHPTGIEITTNDRKSYLLNFASHNSLSVLKAISAIIEFKNVPIQTQNLPTNFRQKAFTEKWLQGEYSNFAYLMLLNKYSGRTFNSESMYPIMPWTIKQYNNGTDDKTNLDLENDETFRDFSKPIKVGEPVSTVNGVIGFLNKCEPFRSVQKYENGKDYPELTSIPKCFIDNEGRELTPEFYFAPEFFPGVELPSWATSPVEFVYLNRKALESRYATEHINEWIDLIWGTKQDELHLDPNYFDTIWDNANLKNIGKRVEIETFKRINGQMPPKMFKEAHPKRSYTTFTPGIVLSHCFKGDGAHKPKYAVLESRNEKIFNFTCVGQDSTIYNIRIDAEKQQSYIKDTNATFKGDVFSLYANFIIGIGQNGELKMARDSGEAMEIHGHHSKGNCLAASQPFVVAGHNDSTLALYRSNEFIKIIPTYSSEITCCDVLASFGLIVAGTADGSLFFLSATDGTPKSYIETNGAIPRKVMITKKWGFVVVYGEIGPKKNVINVYTIHGDLIRRKEINFPINCWTSFSSRSDFDYVVAADGTGKLYLFEAFYANINESFYDCQNSISHIVFSSEMAVAFAFSNNGDVHMAPCVVPV